MTSSMRSPMFTTACFEMIDQFTDARRQLGSQRARGRSLPDSPLTPISQDHNGRRQPPRLSPALPITAPIPCALLDHDDHTSAYRRKAAVSCALTQASHAHAHARTDWWDIVPWKLPIVSDKSRHVLRTVAGCSSTSCRSGYHHTLCWRSTAIVWAPPRS